MTIYYDSLLYTAQTESPIMACMAQGKVPKHKPTWSYSDSDRAETCLPGVFNCLPASLSIALHV